MEDFLPPGHTGTNFRPFVVELERVCIERLAALRILVSSFRDGSALERIAPDPWPDQSIQFELNFRNDPSVSIIRNAHFDAFTGITRGFVEFLDAGMAMIRLTEANEPLSETSDDPTDIASAFYHGIFQESLAIGRDKRWSSPAKTATFKLMTDQQIQVAREIFELRATIEHHHAVPKSEMRLTLVRLTSNPTVGAPGLDSSWSTFVEPGEGYGPVLHLEPWIVTFPAGERIDLGPHHIEGLSLVVMEYLVRFAWGSVHASIMGAV